MNFHGKNALITGANRGIGRALVAAFASNGANIWAHARKETPEFIEEMHTLATTHGVSIWPIFFDITDIAAMQESIKEIYRSKVPVDILINNAGMAHGGMFQMTPMKTIRKVFEVNFFSQLELIQIVSRLMSRRKSGSIINMSSIAGQDLHAGNAAYGTSKAALIAVTRTLAAEFAVQGIRINAVAPGLTDTDMAKLMETKAEHQMIEASAMKRMARIEEIVETVIFLASDKASFITGQTLRVDGGSI